MAYQGLASGDIDEDVFSIRQFLNDGNRICLAQTFSKNMSLYTEHVGALTIICEVLYFIFFALILFKFIQIAEKTIIIVN